MGKNITFKPLFTGKLINNESVVNTRKLFFSIELLQPKSLCELETI